MPRLDKSGPFGLGALSGRGLGPCGKGRRRRNWVGTTSLSKEDQLSSLRQLKQELEELEDAENELLK